VPAISQYAVKHSRPGLVFGFTAFPPDTIRSSFERMQRLLPPAPRSPGNAE